MKYIDKFKANVERLKAERQEFDDRKAEEDAKAKAAKKAAAAK